MFNCPLSSSSLLGDGLIRFLRSAGINVTFCDSDEAIRAQLGEILARFGRNRLAPESIGYFFLRQLERQNATRVLVIELQNHEAVLHRNNITELTLIEFVENCFDGRGEFALLLIAEIAAVSGRIRLRILIHNLGEVFTFLKLSERLFSLLPLRFDKFGPAVLSEDSYFANTVTGRTIEVFDVRIVVFAN
jgi:hypothetical protein